VLGWIQTTIKDGSRSSSATSYLAPQFINRPNLHVLLNARVTRILPINADAFRTVEFVQDLKGSVPFLLSSGSVSGKLREKVYRYC
jgi:choline dehydrogenase-like flavoprotein